MTQGSPPPATDLKSNVVMRIVDWFLGLDTGSKLLVALCVGIAYYVPWVRACMKEDIQGIHQTHRDTVTEMVKSWDSHVDKTIEAFREDQARDQALIEKFVVPQPRAVAARPHDEPPRP